MTDKYLKYSKSAVFGDTSRNGLLVNFLKDYSKQFHTGKLTPSCGSCRATYWNNYLNLFKMNKEKVECDYKLHAKYNGIRLTINGNPIRNGEMTNEIAKQLLEKHPHGANLFEVIPKEEPKKEVKAPVKKKKQPRKK